MEEEMVDLTFPCVFSINLFSRGRVKLCSFVIFNIIISHIFAENFIEIHQVVQKIQRFSPSILSIFIDVLKFFDTSLLQ